MAVPGVVLLIPKSLVINQLGMLAAAAIMTIPVAIVFFIFQKRIMNATAGAVKE